MKNSFYAHSFRVTRLLMGGRTKGFALVITLSLMILLTVIAVGLLTLSSITLRSVSRQSHTETARANARLAVMLALGELQKNAGDDRRITADGSIFQGATHANAVGVWKSWSPRLIESPTTAAPDYATQKSTGFQSWLVSSGDPTALKSMDWAKAGALANPVNLFSISKDGFNLAGSKIEVMKGTPTPGALAWVVSQAATKAKINVAGPENNLVANDGLQAQPRPSLGLSTAYKNPTSEWNRRANRVIAMSQTKLDTDLWKDDALSIPGGANFTTEGFGILSDVVNGGLKTDLSLGFEMSDQNFIQAAWSGVTNPFMGAAYPLTAGSSKYQNQRPLFKPLSDSASLTVPISFAPASVQFEFPVAAVPTFQTLRSFYRTPHHLYNSTDGVTVFERGMDHVAVTTSAIPASFFPSPAKPPAGAKTQTSYRPVVDRVMYLMSVGLDSTDKVCLVATPLVTLWNPYNVALEIEGAVTYPWIDFPFDTKWTIYKADNTTESPGMYMSGLLGSQFTSVGHGRSVDPYFYAAITASGAPISSNASPISFRPGEVRVFAPTSTTPVDFVTTESVRNRTVFLRPVASSDDFNTKGGIRISMHNPARNIGFKRVLVTGESLTMRFGPSGGNFHYFMSMADATLAKGTNPVKTDGGQSIVDVLAMNFTGNVQGGVTTFSTPTFSYAALKIEPRPFGVIEFYHRVAKNEPPLPPPALPVETADLVFTNNPRQTAMTNQVTNSTFASNPQYKIQMRPVGSFDGVIATANSGRSAYYGPTNLTEGRLNLSFFEVPQAPLLSLAAFQHADLSGTPYCVANQFANSWASAYVPREKVATGAANALGSNSLNYDYSYLVNEALWDGFFFSGAAPVLSPGSITGSPAVWNGNGVASKTRTLKNVVDDFVKDPNGSPLRNTRIRLRKENLSDTELSNEILSPEGCVKIARHIMMDGAFNVNSTKIEAWTALLSGMRGEAFDVKGATGTGASASPSADKSPFPRFRNPIGTENDNWQGFRSLSDADLRLLATNIVDQVRLRGPFLSLAEFVNRRVEGSALGLNGTVQAAIDAVPSINANALTDTLTITKFPQPLNISPAKTGVGIPGYLTQADVLQSIAPTLTVRSDTFTIRGYGEARDRNGQLLATARCEAVVQRQPGFVDGSDPSFKPLINVNTVNQRFGRKFTIVSFRYLSPS